MPINFQFRFLLMQCYINRQSPLQTCNTDEIFHYSDTAEILLQNNLSKIVLIINYLQKQDKKT